MSKSVINIDWNLVGVMLEADCSGVQIAGKLGIHENTLYIRCKKDLKMDFVAFRTQKQASGEALLKTKQFKIAMEGDKAMLIWLGKQRLGQKDRHDHTSNDKELKVLTTTEREARIKEIKEKLGIKEDE